MKISTEKEAKIADKVCQIKDFERFIKISEAMIRRISRRQEKLLKIQEQENLTIETN